MCPVSGHRKNHATPSGPGIVHSHAGAFTGSIRRKEQHYSL
jgi:hypothetical protein